MYKILIFHYKSLTFYPALKLLLPKECFHIYVRNVPVCNSETLQAFSKYLVKLDLT
jgi:hypothetical protein